MLKPNHQEKQQFKNKKSLQHLNYCKSSNPPSLSFMWLLVLSSCCLSWDNISNFSQYFPKIRKRNPSDDKSRLFSLFVSNSFSAHLFSPIPANSSRFSVLSGRVDTGNESVRSIFFFLILYCLHVASLIRPRKPGKSVGQMFFFSLGFLWSPNETGDDGYQRAARNESPTRLENGATCRQS